MPNPKVPESVGELRDLIREVRNKLATIDNSLGGKPSEVPLDQRQQSNSTALVAASVIPQDLWEC